MSKEENNKKKKEQFQIQVPRPHAEVEAYIAKRINQKRTGLNYPDNEEE